MLVNMHANTHTHSQKKIIHTMRIRMVSLKKSQTIDQMYALMNVSQSTNGKKKKTICIQYTLEPNKKKTLLKLNKKQSIIRLGIFTNF